METADVVDAMRKISLKILKDSDPLPMTQVIIDPYNDLTSNGLRSIIEDRGAVHFDTDTHYGIVTFENVTCLPPFKAEGIPPELYDMRNRMKAKGKSVTPDDIAKYYNGQKSSDIAEPILPHPTWQLPADVRDAASGHYMLSVYADVTIRKRPRSGGQKIAPMQAKKQTSFQQEDPDEDEDDELDLEELVIPSLFQGGLSSQETIETQPFVQLFQIPLMTGSQWDWMFLAKAPPSDWSFYRECEAEVFGCFIINTKEKVFVTQEKLTQNIPRCFMVKGAKPELVCELRSESADKRSVTARLHYFARDPIKLPKVLIVTLALPFLNRVEKKPTFNILNVYKFYVIWRKHQSRKEEYGQDYDPDEIEDDWTDSSKRALGEFNNYLRECCADEPSQPGGLSPYREILARLIHTINDFSRGDESLDKAFVLKMHAILGFPEMLYGDIVESIKRYFDKELFPHIVQQDPVEFGNDMPWSLEPKLYCLTMMMTTFIKTLMGARPHDDRDAYVTKALATVGAELGTLTEKAFKIVRDSLRNDLRKPPGLANIQSVVQHLSSAGAKMTRDIVSSFSTGNWGLPQHHRRTGVVQSHETMSILARLAMTRKVSIPIRKQAQIAAPRQVPATSYGVVDPTNTPNSDAAGLVKALAIAARITIYDEESEKSALQVVEMLREPDDYADDNHYLRIKAEANYDGRKLIFDSKYEAADDGVETVPMYVNNSWVGFASHPDVYAIFRNEKRSGRLGRYTEVFVKVEVSELDSIRELHVLSTPGRPVKPWFTVGPNNDFVALSRGFLNPDRVDNITLDELVREGAIEFAGPNEFEFSDMAIDYPTFLARTQPPDNETITHIEVDPSFQLAVEAATQPYPQHNPIPRVLYRGNQIRQAQSLPFSTFGSRFATDVKVLNYAHKPLITTDMTSVIGLDQQPTGLNVTVFVMSTGFADEDATVWKKEFLERGGFNSTLFETYDEAQGTGLVGDVTDDPTRFKNGVIRVRRMMTEDDEEEEDEQRRLKPQVPRVLGNTNVRVKPGDLLARMQVTMSSEAEIKETKLVGSRVGLIHSTHLATESQPHVQKIVVRFPHVPGPGDKFGGPAGQKGVVGEVRPEIDMPFAEDGTTPDVIFSPTSFASRMTFAMFLEMLVGKATISCNRNHFVDKLVSWNHGEKDVTIGKDFYIKMIPILVRKAPSKQEVQFMEIESIRTYVKRNIVVVSKELFQQDNLQAYLAKFRTEEERNVMRGYLQNYQDERRKTKTEGEELLIVGEGFKLVYGRGHVSQLQNAARGLKDYEAMIDGFTRDVVNMLTGSKGLWNKKHGLKMKVADRPDRVRYITPNESSMTRLKTGELAILFSQLPPQLRIQYYQEHRGDIVPQFRVKGARDLDREIARMRDATAFRKTDEREVMELLREKGFNYTGKSTVISGTTGQMFEAQIFTGICYYTHLRHLVDSKQQSRDVGSKSLLTRAPVRGKARGGAVRAGEMSRVAILAHGATKYLTERFKRGADEFKAIACRRCGHLCYRNETSATIVCEGCGNAADPLEVSTTWALIKQLSLVGAAGGSVRLIARPTSDADAPGLDPDEAILDPSKIRKFRQRQSKGNQTMSSKPVERYKISASDEEELSE